MTRSIAQVRSSKRSKFLAEASRGRSVEFRWRLVVRECAAPRSLLSVICGMQKIRVGGKAELVCPSNLAYGSRGVPGTIPPDVALIFEVELLDIAK